MNSRNNRSIDMKPNHVKNSDFMSILYSKPLRETKSPNLELEIEFAFPSMFYPPGNVMSHNLHKSFLKLLPLLLKDLQHIQSKTNKEKLSVGNSARRKYLESFEYRVVYNRVDFQRIFAALSKQHAQFIYKLLAGASEYGRTRGGSNFRDFSPIIVPKRYEGELYVLRRETLQNNRGSLSRTRTVILHT